MAKTFIDLSDEMETMVGIKKKLDNLKTKGEVISAILKEYFIQEKDIKKLMEKNESFKMEL